MSSEATSRPCRKGGENAHKEIIIPDPLDQIVLTALHLHRTDGLEREGADTFVRLSTRDSPVD